MNSTSRPKRKLNVREGARRLSVALGIVGGILGAFAGYVGAQDTIRAFAAHTEFKSLMGTPTMVRVAKAAKDYQVDGFAANAPRALPRGFENQTSKIVTRGGSVDYDSLAAQHGGVATPSPPEDIFDQIASESLQKQGLLDVAVDLDGIRSVQVDKLGVVQLITLNDGRAIPKTERPLLRSYLALLLGPILGFLLPWGLIRSLLWIGLGFSQQDH